jgi:site-specific DNA-methyltransferase (adenine-specific)
LWSSDRKQATTLQFDRPTRNDIHPTMKPVSLFEYQIKNNTRAGDIVLDSFGGSGTTLIASEQCGRTSRLMEYSPIYVDAIIARWQRHTGKQAILESDGRTFNEIAEMLGK